METTNQAISLGTNHWTNQHFSNAEVHPFTGKEIEYMALMKDPGLNLFGKEALVMRWPTSSKVSTKFKAPTHISLLNSIKYQSIDKLLIPQVSVAHKYPNSPWEMIHPPGGDNAVCM
jgi:hypothetical protein